jgi:hypothetical protein
LNYLVTIYFTGPKTQWSGKVATEEIIGQRSYRWWWMARLSARSSLENLNLRRCGYVIQKGDEVLEHVEALTEDEIEVASQ